MKTLKFEIKKCQCSIVANASAQLRKHGWAAEKFGNIRRGERGSRGVALVWAKHRQMSQVAEQFQANWVLNRDPIDALGKFLPKVSAKNRNASGVEGHEGAVSPQLA